MKYFSFILAILLFLSGNLLAQTDSIKFVNAPWKIQKIAPGIKWKSCLFTNKLFGYNQSINIVEVKPRRKIHLNLGYEVKTLKPTSDFGKSKNAVAALNGTFFDVKNGGSVDFLKADNKIINGNRLDKNGERAGHQKSAILFKQGKLSIAKWDGSADWEKRLTSQNIMVTGPLLILNEQTELLDTANSFNKTRHPRTAIAITKNNRVLLITIDGRNENAAGMNLFELSNVLRWLKSKDGLNLDGGGSTTLWIKNQTPNGVVNYPSDNKKWDHEGERKVANVILLER